MASVVFAILLVGGCSQSSGVAEQESPNAKLIQGTERAIEQWKEMVALGEWKKMIDEGVATDAIDDDSFISKPAEFPAFKIEQLEKRLAELKQESGTPGQQQ